MKTIKPILLSILLAILLATNISGQSVRIGGSSGSGSGTVTNAAPLTANLPVIGAGSDAVAVGTRSGNTTQYVTTTGTQTSGRCVEIDANGNHIAASAACGSGGGGSTIYAARIGSSTAVSIPNNTVTAIAFDTEACTGCFDTTTLHDNATNNTRITIPAAAKCTVGGSIAYASHTGGSYRGIYIYLNGSGGTLLDNQQKEQGAGSNQFGLGSVPIAISTTFHAAANDYVELYAYQDSGVSVNINQASYSPIFWINCVAD